MICHKEGPALVGGCLMTYPQEGPASVGGCLMTYPQEGPALVEEYKKYLKLHIIKIITRYD